MSLPENLSAILPSGAALRLPDRPVRVLGIDLGTTNSTMSEIVWEPGATVPPAPRLIEVDQPTLEGTYTHSLVPSVVAIHGGGVVVGEGAKRLRSRAAELGLERGRDLFYECKNDIGQRRTYHRAPEGFRSAPEIGGHVVRFMLDAALAADPTPPDRVVVSVPASFQLAQREDTIRAMALAGLDVAGGDLVDEPVAAFIDYLLGHGKDAPGVRLDPEPAGLRLRGRHLRRRGPDRRRERGRRPARDRPARRLPLPPARRRRPRRGDRPRRAASPSSSSRTTSAPSSSASTPRSACSSRRCSAWPRASRRACAPRSGGCRSSTSTTTSGRSWSAGCRTPAPSRPGSAGSASTGPS